jgi:hypothetical protein
MRTMSTCLLTALALTAVAQASRAADALPFDTKVETYRNQERQITVFALRLEQPFLAGEFEKNKYLRLRPHDESAWLIYPRQTQFVQKHAEFYGRLRTASTAGETATLTLSYDIVSENADGSRSVDVREAEIEIDLPQQDGGSESLFKEWARRQNEHFAELLRYYPHNSFLEYVLLQSADRYGVSPPSLPGSRPSREENDRLLYNMYSSGLAVQQSLQWEVLRYGPRAGDRTIHISSLSPPSLRSLDYEQRLAQQREKGIEPQPHEIARMVPADQYFAHVSSLETATELLEFSEQWGGNLLRIFQVTARDHHLREKYLEQLAVDQQGLAELFQDKVIAEMAATGGDLSFGGGTDITLIFRLTKPAAFRDASKDWLAVARKRYPELAVREFNYRGRQVEARYTNDRTVSSFVVYDGDHVMISNSHRAIRKAIDTALGELESLYDQADYQYMTTLLPPRRQPQSAYIYASEAFLKRLVSPAHRIAEKRRLQAFNNLVMLNNASLFYRLENGRSPTTLSQLADGDYINMQKVVDPSGGGYAFDAEKDTATSSVYNRIKYLTPVGELDVLQVSSQERDEYNRFKERYAAFWSNYFDPVAVRVTTGPTIQLETAVLPFADRSTYGALQRMLADRPLPLGTADYAKSSVASLALTPGRKAIGEWIRAIPGAPEALEADPTLTDLAWLGDRVTMHFCDDDMMIEIDPTRLEEVKQFGFPVSVPLQAGVAGAVTALTLPTYATIDVEDEEKAQRLLELLRSRIFLEGGGNLAGLETRLDAYRLPDYKGRAIYVMSYQVYAVRVRLHLALVGGKLVAATKQDTLEQVIDAAGTEPDQPPQKANGLLRINFRAMEQMKDDLQMYWAEKARQASHDNIMPLYVLVKLYDVSVEEANKISDAKYGVTYFDPGGGKYVYDADRDQVYSTVFGNRRNARQDVTLDDDSPFAQFFNRLEEITASLRFEDDVLMGDVRITRRRN